MPAPILVPFGRRAHAPVARGIGDIDRMFNNLFHNALTNLAAPASGIGDLAVRMDVTENETGYTVQADLPGFDDSQIDVTVHDGVLTLKGERQSESHDGKTVHRVERNYGLFKRAMQLPPDADEGQIAASMKNGVLTVTVGKSEQSRKTEKRIAITRE